MNHQSPQFNTSDKSIFGFWVYLMTDLVMFAGLFAAFAVLRNSTFGGPTGADLFNLPNVLIETLILLTSSFTCGLMMLAAHQGKKNQVITWIYATIILGAGFLVMEINEFSHLISEGHGYQTSAFLSSFFTLLGTHGLHIFIGLFWIVALLVRILQVGLTEKTIRQLTMLSLFWHFLDIVWIFIFTIVYLMGAK